MNHCPYLTNDNRCQVASKMAQCAVKATASGCEACQQDSNPQAVNLVTIGMALVERGRRHKPTDELKNTNRQLSTRSTVTYFLQARRLSPRPR